MDLLRRSGGPIKIAGIIECQDALLLVERGRVEIVSGTITDEGGSGVIREKLS